MDEQVSTTKTYKFDAHIVPMSSEKLSITLPNAYVKWLKERAAVTNSNVSRVIRAALEQVMSEVNETKDE